MMLRLLVCAILCLLSVATADCPEKCKCNKYKTTCWNSKLYGLPHGLDNLTEFVRVQNDQIIELNQDTVSQLPTRLKELQLISILLQEIKNLTFQNMELLESLIITGNNINILIAGTFKGLYMLHKLDLSQNHISNLKPGVFDGLESLRHLNMSYNQIKILEQGIFNGMKSIVQFNSLLFQSKLDFSFNEIEHIEPGTFQNASIFTHVNLEGCKAVPLLSGMFQGLRGVKILHMTNRPSFRNSQNNHTSLTKDVLQEISSLVTLNLRNSGITNIQNLTFEGYNSLSQLDISLNFISTLRGSTFFGLSFLKMLTLYKNYIRLIHNDAFEGLYSLISLNLGQCKIKMIYSDAFRGLVKLRFLDLSENNLSTLTSHVFSDLVMLKEVILHGNNIMNLEALNRLVSLKNLKLLSTGYNINNGAFLSLRRLDDLKTTNVESLTGQQVLRTLHIHISMDKKQINTVGDELHRILQGVQFLQEFELTISKIYSISQIGDISAFRFTMIDISHNILSLFIEDIFKNQTSLNSLKISHCDITFIKVGVFQDLISLADLDISYNSGIQLRFGTFLGLNKLKQLNVSFNEMDNLQVGIFFGLDNLQLLDISNNEISTLQVGIFEGLNSIKILNISENSISTLGEGVFGAVCIENFNSTCGMSYIYSQYCNISHVLVTLRYLDLSHNEITHIHPHTFINCINLEKLDLSHNEMFKFDTNFLNTPALRTLILNSCNINILPTAIFDCTRKLSEIQLSFNKIQNVNIIESFGHLLNLKDIILSGNPITCDCQQQVLWQWLRDLYLVHGKSYKLYFPHDSNCSKEKILSIIECNNSTPLFYGAKQYNTYHVTFFNRNIEPIIMIMLFISGFVGNSFVIYEFLVHTEMRICPNMCIASLASAHCLFLILYLSAWKSSLTTFKLMMVIKNLVVGITVFSILVMSLQKFIILRSVSKPILEFSLYQRKMTIFLNLIVWGSAIGAVVPLYFPSKQEILCFPENEEYFKRISMSQLIVYCIIPILVIVCLETFNYLFLSENVSRLQVESLGVSKAEDRRKRFLNLPIILVFVFILSYFPTYLIKVLVVFSIVNIENMLFLPTLFSYLFFCNSIINPLIVFTMSTKYQTILIRHFASRLAINNKKFSIYAEFYPIEENSSCKTSSKLDVKM